jgi:hypothetical protein
MACIPPAIGGDMMGEVRDMEDRPLEIIILIGSMFVSSVQMGLVWTEVSGMASAIALPPVLLMLYHMAGVAVMLVLTLLVSRMRARFAALVFQGLFLLCLPGYVFKIMNGASQGVELIGIITLFLMVLLTIYYDKMGETAKATNPAKRNHDLGPIN